MPHGTGAARKAVVVCPSSLVGQWAKEFQKWVSFRLKVQVVDGVLGEPPAYPTSCAPFQSTHFSSRSWTGAGKVLGQGSAHEQVKTFCTSPSTPVLILSYEVYRREADTLNACSAIDLMGEVIFIVAVALIYWLA